MSKTNIASAAAVRLALRHPFWTEVFYSMTIREATPDEVAAGIQTEATDGRNLWINKDFWKTIPLDQQVAELVHELYHKILLHNTRRGGREHMLWNMACDYVINAAMKKQGFNFPCSGNNGDWLYDAQYDGWLAESVYTDLLKKRKEGKNLPGLSPMRQDLKDAQGIETPEGKSQVEAQITAMVDRAIAFAKAMGTLPAGIAADVAQATKPSAEPWYNHLHRYMQSLRASGYNWARVNRRALRTHGCFAPLHYGEALGEIALFIDASGSCFQAAQQAQFAQHLQAILSEAKPFRVHVYFFDVVVYPGIVLEVNELDFTLKPQGGGGTSFRDLFTTLEADGVEPELAIVLTDLCGSFPDDEPAYPVIWANTEPGMDAPFGEVIDIRND